MACLACLLGWNDFLKQIFFKSFYWVFIILFIQYYSVICRPSDQTVGRPQAEILTLAGQPRGRDTTPRPPHQTFCTKLLSDTKSKFSLAFLTWRRVIECPRKCYPKLGQHKFLETFLEPAPWGDVFLDFLESQNLFFLLTGQTQLCPFWGPCK